MEPVAFLAAEAQKLLDKGDFDSAENLFLLALQIKERLFGVQSLEITGTLFNLGLLYFAKSDYVKAEELLLRCLSIERRELAASDRQMAETVNMLTEIHIEKYLKRRLQKLAISA